MDDNGILTSTNQQLVEHWSWHHAKFIWNGEKRTLVGLGVVGIIGTAIAAGVAAGAGSLIMTSGAASAAAEAGVAFGCVTPFVVLCWVGYLLASLEALVERTNSSVTRPRSPRISWHRCLSTCQASFEKPQLQTPHQD